MAIQGDISSEELDSSSVSGVVSNTEASDSSSRDDTSLHEIEAVAEEVRGSETIEKADGDVDPPDDWLRRSSASNETHAELFDIPDMSQLLSFERQNSPLSTSDKPAELRSPLLPRLSTSRLSGAQTRTCSTVTTHLLTSDSVAISASVFADLPPTASAKNPSASTFEQLGQKVAEKGSFGARRDGTAITKLGGDQSVLVELKQSKETEPTPTMHIVEQPSFTSTTAPAVPRPLSSGQTSTYFSLPPELRTSGPRTRIWNNAPSKAAPTIPASRYPLEHRWTFYRQTPRDLVSKKKAAGALFSRDRPAYESSLTELGDATSVESFARLFVPLKTPSTQETGTSIYIFKMSCFEKDGIIPAWEHEANANGGKWSLLIKGDTNLLERSWLWLVLALVGEELSEGDEICGSVLSVRPRDSRIQLWCRDKSRISHLNALGHHLLNVLELSSNTKGLHFEFFPHNAGPLSPSSKCFSINNSTRPAKAGESRRGSSFDAPTSVLGALPESAEGIHRIKRPSLLGTTMTSGPGWRKPATVAGESMEPAPSGGEGDGRSAVGSSSRLAGLTSRSAWY